MSHDFICLICPNGCHLTMDVQNDQSVGLQGNRCDKGFDFARTFLDSDKSKNLIRERSAYSDDAIKKIAASWGISLKAVCRSLIPEGSPERTLFRVVIEDKQGARFILEEIPASACYAKMRIIKSLEFLSQKGLTKITPYLADAKGQYIQKHDQGFWQLSPFINGIPLDRRTYLYEDWRAEVLSSFLIELREKSERIPFFSLEEKFSLKNYIFTLVRQIEMRTPVLMQQISQVLAFLEKDFMDVYDSLPVGFCHGDYHPLNIIWGKEDIRSVIDWEFAGMKPEIYDLVNMVGCLGIEHPSSLLGDLVTNLIARLRAAHVFSDISWDYFIEFVVAMRFAWLSEWLRKDDREMVALELDYMDLLIQNREKLRQEWMA